MNFHYKENAASILCFVMKNGENCIAWTNQVHAICSLSTELGSSGIEAATYFKFLAPKISSYSPDLLKRGASRSIFHSQI